jgi:hypothetical protein
MLFVYYQKERASNEESTNPPKLVMSSDIPKFIWAEEKIFPPYGQQSPSFDFFSTFIANSKLNFLTLLST